MAKFHVVPLMECIFLNLFARVCSHVDGYNARYKCLTAKLLKQGYRYHKLRKFLSKFYRRHHEFVSTFNVVLKSFLLLAGGSGVRLYAGPTVSYSF